MGGGLTRQAEGQTLRDGARLSEPGELARRHDPDRYLCALFAPAGKREALFTLVALNHELARAREATSQPMLALIRLQWWREVAEGAVRRHPVAEPLAALLHAGVVDRDGVLAMIAGRETEADEAIATTDAWREYVRATAGTLAATMGRALGAEGHVLRRIADLGAAYGVAGQLGNVAAVASQGRCLLPLDLLAARGLSAEAVVARPDDARLRPVLAELAQWGRELLGRSERLPRAVLAAGLPGVLARRDLRRLGGARGVSDRIAVGLAAARGRV